MHNHGPNKNASQKAKDFGGSIKKLFTHDKKLFRLMIIAWVSAAISSILTLIGPDKLKEITNTITSGIMTGIDMDKVAEIGIMLICLYGAGAILNYIEGFVMAHVTTTFTKNMRSAVSSKINRLPLSYFDRTTVGDTLSRMTNDIDTIGHTMNESFSTLVVAITMFIGSLFMMFKTSSIMAITAIASTVIGFIFMILILSRSQKYFTKVQEELGRINGHIEEVYSGHNVIKAYNGDEEVKRQFEKINESLFENGRKSQFFSGLMHPIMSFIGNFGYVAVCIVGAILTMQGSITFGVIVAFMLYIRFFTQPLTQFAQAMAQLQSTAAASERVFEFLEADELNDEKDKKISLDKNTVKGSIEFKNVKFSYNKDKPIIKNFSAKIKPGEKVAIVGPTGAGKTTIVNLLMKFYEINDGDILIDDVSINDLKRANVHDLFVMVLQDTWLFEGTVMDNIRYNDSSITDEKIKSACKSIGLDHFIKTLPHGYETILNDAGTISQGQKQLITIARAMVDNSPFLILDEATSSVDTRTEQLVQEAMDKLAKNRTSFIIAHRLSTIKNADLILVMKDGNIVEQGSHEQLLEKGGFYAELYNSQFQEMDEEGDN